MVATVIGKGHIHIGPHIGKLGIEHEEIGNGKDFGENVGVVGTQRIPAFHIMVNVIDWTTDLREKTARSE